MNDEEWYVILSMNCKYEICRMCPKSGLFKGSYEECEKWIEQKQKEELKDELQIWKKASENNSYKAFQLQEENKTLSAKLTKAKEIIKTFLGFAEAFGYSPSMDEFITEVEQFLK